MWSFMAGFFHLILFSVFIIVAYVSDLLKFLIQSQEGEGAELIMPTCQQESWIMETIQLLTLRHLTESG